MLFSLLPTLIIQQSFVVSFLVLRFIFRYIFAFTYISCVFHTLPHVRKSPLVRKTGGSSSIVLISLLFSILAINHCVKNISVLNDNHMQSHLKVLWFKNTGLPDNYSHVLSYQFKEMPRLNRS